MGMSVAIWVVVGSLLAWGWRVMNWLWLLPRMLEKRLRQQGFAGNSYRLYHGDLKENAAVAQRANSNPMNFSHDIAPRVTPFIHQTVKNYGELSFAWEGPTPRLIIMEPELLKTVLSLNNDFQKPKSNPLVTKFIITGLISYEGSKWLKHRKIINPAFHLEKLKDMVPAFLQCCNELIGQWEGMVSKDGSSSCELDVMPYLQTLSADAISRAAFGSNFEEGKKIFKLLEDMIFPLMQVERQVYIPGWRRQRAIQAGEATNNDLLGILMESNLKEIQDHGNNKDAGISIEDVVEECKLFYFAGQESTATLLVWTMVLLSSHPEWQERARSEVLEVYGNNKPDFDGLNRLKVITMILNEVLRLYPPAGMFTRSIDKETKLGNLTLPNGVLLGVPILLIHHDRQLWGEDADEFKPERFSKGISKSTKNQLSFFPFGWGPRMCIGQNFAMIEAKTALSLILQHFSFELSSSYTHAPRVVLNIQPQYGAHIILHKLS